MEIWTVNHREIKRRRIGCNCIQSVSTRQEYNTVQTCYNKADFPQYTQNIDGILRKGPYRPCVSMAGRALWQDTIDIWDLSNSSPFSVRHGVCFVVSESDLGFAFVIETLNEVTKYTSYIICSADIWGVFSKNILHTSITETIYALWVSHSIFKFYAYALLVIAFYTISSEHYLG